MNSVSGYSTTRRSRTEGMAAGFETYWNNLKFIFKHPFMLIPFILALLASSYIIYVVQQEIDIDALSTAELFGIAFLFTAISTFFISITALFVLELLEQHETTGVMQPGKALKDMITRDLWRALPFIFVWAIIDFAITVLIAAIESAKYSKDSYRKKRRARRSITGLKLFQTTIRMGTMTIFTIIAWENLSVRESYRKGLRVFKDQILVLIGGSALSQVSGLIMIVPALVFYFIGDYANIDPVILYYVLIGYLVLTWSISRLVEQLFVSEYYLWFYMFEQAQDKARRYHEEIPKTMYDIEKPSFTDDVQSLEKDIPYED